MSGKSFVYETEEVLEKACKSKSKISYCIFSFQKKPAEAQNKFRPTACKACKSKS